MMYSNEFGERLSLLREQTGVSARDMSLSIGQNAGYINNIENGNNLPSMTSFFYICDYLHIRPSDFFDTETPAPGLVLEIDVYLKKMNKEKLEHLLAIVKYMTQ